jgi:hypothetical protein
MVQTMSAITLEQARAKLDALMAAAEVGNFRSVSIGGRTVTYGTLQELQSAIDSWAGWVTRLERQAAGGGRARVALADFRGSR